MSSIPPKPPPGAILNGTPPWRGTPKGAGKPKGEGVARGTGKLPGDGVPREAGKLPDQDGVVVKGTPGQMDRGAPGQMDPWAENPWAPGEGPEGEWGGGIPPVDPELLGDDDFYMQHPNFQGEDDKR